MHNLELEVCPSCGHDRLMTAIKNCVVLFERDYIQTGLIDTLTEPMQDSLIETFGILGAIAWSTKDDPQLEQWLKDIKDIYHE